MSNQPIPSDSNVRAILDGMVDGVITINDKGIILSFNKSAEHMFGYKAEEAVGQNVNIIMPQPEHSRHNEYLDRYIETENAHIIGIGRDVTALRKNGEQFPMRLYVTEYPSKIKEERWFIGSCLDITLQKQQEEQLNRSIKMEALGALSGGISHDYKNMLGVIVGYCDLIKDEYANDSKLLHFVKQITCAAQRGSELTQQLLNFSRKRPPKTQAVVINDILLKNKDMLEKTLTTQITLNVDLDENLWPTLIDAGCLEDTFLNISINALHAMPDGGTLLIQTTNTHVNELASQALNINSGDYVILTIIDTGKGMSREVASHIFEPFYSTKGEKGTGLGLSQAYNFATNSGGTIIVDSELGNGTRFFIYLPRTTSDQTSLLAGQALESRELKTAMTVGKSPNDTI